jgi:hypothetical protein
MVALYMSIFTTSQPSGTEVGVSDVIFLLSKVVEPTSPGMATMMLREGTEMLFVSSWLHDVMMPANASIATM